MTDTARSAPLDWTLEVVILPVSDIDSHIWEIAQPGTSG
jgi:hypothetical protein